MDKSTAGHMQVPCGRCRACRLAYSKTWMLRMMHERKAHDEASFVTLTYGDSFIPKNGSLEKTDCQEFFKRLRKNTGKKVRYFLAGEYGEKYSRPHYHVILYGMGKKDIGDIERAWGKGFVTCGDVTEASCMYVAKYIVKKLNGPLKKIYDERNIIPEFSLMSRKPGIGENHVTRYADEIVNRGFMVNNGFKMGIPRYYSKKLEQFGKGEIQKETRRRNFVLVENKKTLDKIAKQGYDGCDRETLNTREHLDNTLKAKLELRRNKI